MFKSSIKNAPNITGKRLVPKKNDVSDTSITQVSPSSSDAGGEQVSTSTGIKTPTRPTEALPQVSYFTKIFSPLNERKLSEATKEDMQFQIKGSKYQKNYAEKTERDSDRKPPKEEPSSNSKDVAFESNFSAIIKISKDKLQQCDAQLSFFELCKKENSRILEKKYSQIRELNEKIERLLEDKEHQNKEIFIKNKKIEELSNENRFKDIKIKQLQTNSERDDKKTAATPRRRLGSNLHQPEQDMLRKSNTDWGIKLSTLKNEKQSTIISLQNQIQELQSAHQKQINEVREQSSNKLAEMQRYYQKTIYELERSFANQTQNMKQSFASEYQNQQNKSHNQKMTLQKFYDKKLIQITNFYEQKLISLKNVPAEHEETIKNMRSHHQAQIQILKEEFSKEKEFFFKNHQHNIEEERKKYNDVVRVLTNKNRQLQTQIQNLKIMEQQQKDQILNLEKQLKKKQKKILQNEKILQADKNRYKRMEDLWRDQKMKNDTLKIEKQFEKKQKEELQQKNNMLTETIENMSKQLVIKDQNYQQQCERSTKLKDSYSKIISDKNREIFKASKSLQAQKADISILEEHIKEGAESIEQLSQKIVELNKKKQEDLDLYLRQRESQKQNYEEWLAAKDALAKQLKEQIATKEKELVSYQANNTSLQEKIQQKVKLIEQSETIIKNKECLIANLQAKIEELSNMQCTRQYGQLKLKVLEISPKLQTLLSEIQSNEHKLTSLTDNFNSLINQSVEQQAELMSLKEKVEQQSSTKMIKFLQIKQEENQQLSVVNTKLQKELKYLKFCLQDEKELNAAAKRGQIMEIVREQRKYVEKYSQETQTVQQNSQFETKDIGCGDTYDVADLGVGQSSIHHSIDSETQIDTISTVQFGCGNENQGLLQENEEKIQLASIGCGDETFKDYKEQETQYLWEREEKGCGDDLLLEMVEYGVQSQSVSQEEQQTQHEKEKQRDQEADKEVFEQKVEGEKQQQEHKVEEEKEQLNGKQEKQQKIAESNQNYIQKLIEYQQIGINTEIQLEDQHTLTDMIQYSNEGVQVVLKEKNSKSQSDHEVEKESEAAIEKKDSEEEESDESLSNKEKKSGQEDPESFKDDESSAREQDEKENSESQRQQINTGDLADEVRVEKEDDDTPPSEGKYSINELLDELQEKEFVIEEMSQCIQDYKQMVWDMKQRLENREDFEENYREVLGIFSLEMKDVSKQTHTYLIELINGYTVKVSQMMMQLEKMQELNNQNQSLNASKKKFIKELKKCKHLIEKVQLQNEQLDKRLNEEIFKNQKIQHETKELHYLLEETNHALTAARAHILNQKMNSISDFQEQNVLQAHNQNENNQFSDNQRIGQLQENLNIDSKSITEEKIVNEIVISEKCEEKAVKNQQCGQFDKDQWEEEVHEEKQLEDHKQVVINEERPKKTLGQIQKQYWEGQQEKKNELNRRKKAFMQRNGRFTRKNKNGNQR